MEADGRHFIISTLAKTDLAEIYQYRLQQEGYLRAEKVIDSFQDSFTQIERFPELFPIFHKAKSDKVLSSTRVKSHFGIYHIIYDVDESEIRILRVWHAARNPRKLKLT